MLNFIFNFTQIFYVYTHTQSHMCLCFKFSHFLFLCHWTTATCSANKIKYVKHIVKNIALPLPSCRCCCALLVWVIFVVGNSHARCNRNTRCGCWLLAAGYLASALGATHGLTPSTCSPPRLLIWYIHMYGQHAFPAFSTCVNCVRAFVFLQLAICL